MRAALLLVPVVAACHGGGSTVDADNGTYNCAADTRPDPWQIPLVKQGMNQAMQFSLVDAMPAPPVRGDNTWVVQINTMANGVVGAPMTGATMAVTPYMPDHGHISAKQVIVTPMATAGQYQLSPINVWMPGYWTVTIQASAAGGVADTAVYGICLPN